MYFSSRYLNCEPIYFMFSCTWVRSERKCDVLKSKESGTLCWNDIHVINQPNKNVNKENQIYFAVVVNGLCIQLQLHYYIWVLWKARLQASSIYKNIHERIGWVNAVLQWNIMLLQKCAFHHQIDMTFIHSIYVDSSGYVKQQPRDTEREQQTQKIY